MKKNCKNCGDEFDEFALTGKRSKHIYCEKCRSMELKRICPECGDEILYYNIHNLMAGKIKNSLCVSCRGKIEIKKVNDDVTNGLRKNGFDGKTHTIETKKEQSLRRKANDEKYKTEEFREKISRLNKGDNNPMYEKSFYECWVENYGKDEADEMLAEYKKKKSVETSGENNPMYGKPSPQGSGNGWSGWYNGWFFRSLRELSYMINVIERFDLPWRCGEKNNEITWELDGRKRTYRPDFIINDEIMIEIKPTKLWNSLIVTLKKDAATLWCEKNNMVYEIVDPPILDDKVIKRLRNEGLLVFTDRYEKKFKEKYDI